PGCGVPDDEAFPLDTRIHGGPSGYTAGGPFQDWRLDLTNTTGSPCSGIHPVLVLTDRDRVLRPEQIRFEFYDAGAARWHPVAFQETSEAENVGVFTDFGGFAVPAGETLTVPVRLAFRAGTAPGEVLVNAAIIQRRGADGDWIGDSGAYRLTIGPTTPTTPTTPTAPAASAEPSGPTTPPGTTAPAVPAEPSGNTRSTKPPKPSPPADPTVPVAPTAPPGSTAPARPTGTPAPSATFTRPPSAAGEAPAQTRPTVPELAHTGSASDARARALAPFAVALLLLGAALVRAGRRHRRS
ncbi:hypothetical protein AB9128_19695, partial [Streptomyces cinereoruber]|uniref:hypothetical protein n=1 Tax=Streptomyces cinereoruber TaxID=67260 RepID=UPI003EC13C6E